MSSEEGGTANVTADAAGATDPPLSSSTNGPAKRSLADVFDNEALWNADDTDDYILTIAGDVAVSLEKSVVELLDAGGNSLLHMAAIWNRPKVMESLIRKGIELNDRNTNGQAPLDLATHYGNVDLALQLRHYGAKHTCESERDFAIAQRDLAQQQLRDVDTDLGDALLRLKRAKQEREELRVERDRLAVDVEALTAQRDSLTEEKTALEQTVSMLTKENQSLLLQVAQTREALACECDARKNATQSWLAAQQVITELQERELSFRAREDETNRLRDEARADRDVARELARLAQLDLGKARQAQQEAEQERDVAVGKQIEAENAIASEKELWAKRIAKTERDRKNIQIEIDRQTEALRKECDRLEKQLRTANTLTWTLREELADKMALAERVQGKMLYLESVQHQLEATRDQLERQVTELEEAQRTEHKRWREQLEQLLREEADSAMRRIVSEVASTADKVAAHDHTLRSLSQTARREFLMQPELTTSLLLDASALTPSSSMPSLKKPTTLLPLLPERSLSSAGSNASTLSLPTQSGSMSIPVADTVRADHLQEESSEPLEFSPASTAHANIVTSARAAMHLRIEQLTFEMVADLVFALAEAVRKHMDEVVGFITRNWRHFRKQVQALEKMVERKDELISRFNQHRRDKPKKQPARLRECIYRPQI